MPYFAAMWHYVTSVHPVSRLGETTPAHMWHISAFVNGKYCVEITWVDSTKLGPSPFRDANSALSTNGAQFLSVAQSVERFDCSGYWQDHVKTMSKQPWTILKIPQPCKQKTVLTPCARDMPRILALVVLCSTKDDLGIPWFWSLGISGSHILYNSLKTKGTYQLLAGKGKLTARQNNYNSCVSWYGMCLLHNIAKIRTVTYTGLVWVFAIGLFACLIMLQRDTAGHVFAVNVQNHIFQIFTAHVQTV